MLDPHREYELTVRQEPKQARICGVGADRRPIDPPPIIQLRIIDPDTCQPPSPANPDADDADPNYVQNPYYFMFASLAKPDDDTELHWLKDGKTQCTTGSVVSSLYHLKSAENRNEDAGSFLFPDLSVHTEGTYRLKFSLFEVIGTVRHCKSIYSTLFYVYTVKENSGMEESTPVSCSLADQGIKTRIRKDIHVRKCPIAALVSPADAAPPNNGKNRKVAQEQTGDDPHVQQPCTPLSSQPASSNSASGPAVKRARHGTLAGPLHLVSGSASAVSPAGSDAMLYSSGEYYTQGHRHGHLGWKPEPWAPSGPCSRPSHWQAWPKWARPGPAQGLREFEAGPGTTLVLVSLGLNEVRYPRVSYASGAPPVPVPGWGPNSGHAHGLGQQETLIHLAPLMHVPGGIGGASTGSPALPSVSENGGYPMIRPLRAPLEQDVRGGIKTVLSIGGIISDGV